MRLERTAHSLLTSFSYPIGVCAPLPAHRARGDRHPCQRKGRRTDRCAREDLRALIETSRQRSLGCTRSAAIRDLRVERRGDRRLEPRMAIDVGANERPPRHRSTRQPDLRRRGAARVPLIDGLLRQERDVVRVEHTPEAFGELVARERTRTSDRVRASTSLSSSAPSSASSWWSTETHFERNRASSTVPRISEHPDAPSAAKTTKCVRRNGDTYRHGTPNHQMADSSDRLHRSRSASSESGPAPQVATVTRPAAMARF